MNTITKYAKKWLTNIIAIIIVTILFIPALILILATTFVITCILFIIAIIAIITD